MRRTQVAAIAALLFTSALAGCDRDVVYRERPIFQQPRSEALQFLGYSDEDDKLTVCGNCHVGQQREWQATEHADAWATLAAVPSKQPFCEACHSTNSLGNAMTGTQGGYVATGESRYHDVQCESCHGPGLTHVQNPDASQPLAPIRVSTTQQYGCGECHSGAHHPFVEEWEASGHATPLATPAGREECNDCHEASGILAAWGVKAEYLEKDSLGVGKKHLGITCAVCHDPHDATNPGQLRFAARNAPGIEQHLCAQCHNRRTAPLATSAQGLAPHAPEAALLVGDAGHFFPGTNVNQGEILGTHGSGRNPGLCTTCHVTRVELNDTQGNFLVTATGHTFNAIPCKDAQGVPQPGTTHCAVTLAARRLEGCAGAQCHDPAAAVSALRTASLRTQTLATELLNLLRTVDPNLTGAGGQIDGANPVFTVAEGAYFNYRLATFSGDIEGTGGAGITTWGSTAHNPFLIESLLITSIQEVRRAYNLPASSTSPSLEPQLKRPVAHAAGAPVAGKR